MKQLYKYIHNKLARYFEIRSWKSIKKETPKHLEIVLCYIGNDIYIAQWDDDERVFYKTTDLYIPRYNPISADKFNILWKYKPKFSAEEYWAIVTDKSVKSVKRYFELERKKIKRYRKDEALARS